MLSLTVVQQQQLIPCYRRTLKGFTVEWARIPCCTAADSAACNLGSPDTVSVLLAAWPEADMEVDEECNAPLHFTAAFQAHPDVVRLLIAANPVAAGQRGRLGRLPLSVALLCAAHPESIMATIDAYPDAQRDPVIVGDRFDMGHGVDQLRKAGALLALLRSYIYIYDYIYMNIYIYIHGDQTLIRTGYLKGKTMNR